MAKGIIITIYSLTLCKKQAKYDSLKAYIMEQTFVILVKKFTYSVMWTFTVQNASIHKY